jgi:integrase
MPRADIERLLAGCERSTLDGARDFAMVMLLARLGLRCVEISRLALDDIDWRSGQTAGSRQGSPRRSAAAP